MESEKDCNYRDTRDCVKEKIEEDRIDQRERRVNVYMKFTSIVFNYDGIKNDRKVNRFTLILIQ